MKGVVAGARGGSGWAVQELSPDEAKRVGRSLGWILRLSLGCVGLLPDCVEGQGDTVAQGIYFLLQ